MSGFALGESRQRGSKFTPTMNRCAIWRDFLLAATAVLVAFASPVARAADGDLDPTFGNGGKVLTDFGGQDELGRVAVQPDGKIIASGVTRTGTGPNKYALARYNPDGSLDATFGNGGRVVTVLTNGTENSNALLLLPDGKIMIAGSIALPSVADFSWALVRYNADGSLDSTFGNNGLVTTNIGPSYDSIGRLALQPDGKIVAAGNTAIPRPPGEERNGDIAVARYNADGSLDPSFGNNGIVISDFGSVPHYFADDATAVLLQPDGKIIVAGDSDGGGYYDFLVARYNANGTLDATFGNNGFTKTDVGNGFEDGASDAVLQPDGKIVLVGAANRSYASNLDFAVLRYNANGTLDATFGNGGQTVFVLDNLADEEFTSVVLQPDGKIIALGDSNSSNRRGFLLARLKTDGALDATFGTGGIVATSFGSNSVQSAALVSQPDGRLVAGGFTPLYNTGDFALARYEFASPLQMTSAVSRKTHGSAGTFDIPLALSGPPAVECRSSGGDHTLVFTFNRTLSDGHASMVQGTAAIRGKPVYTGNTLIVNLSGVADAQTIVLTLSGVTDSTGQVMPPRNVSLQLLSGDVNGNGSVNASDVAQTKANAGTTVDQSNFRSDVVANGSINSSDVAAVKAASGGALVSGR